MVIVIIGWQVASHYMIKNRTVPELEETPTTQETPTAPGAGEIPIDPTTQATPEGIDTPLSPDLWTAIEESPDDTKVNVQTDNYSIVL